MKEVPTLWEETVFIDGYPGKYSVIARRHQNQWFVAGVNAENAVQKLTLKLPMLAGKSVRFINDDSKGETSEKTITVGKNGELKIEIQSKSGFVIH
ncbi:glycoside hydrolase family 97 C-terminal domain-containing protein [Chryseobacterium arachidis]